MKYERGSFITVPSKDTLRGINPIAQSLYMWLCAYANETGHCYPSRKTLATDVGCSEATIDRMTMLLIEKGLLKKKHQRTVEGDLGSNLYTVLIVGGGLTVSTPSPHIEATVPSQVRSNSIHITQPTEQGAGFATREIRVEEETPKRERKDTSYYQVYELFGSPWPLDWKMNTTEIQAAKNLLTEHGLEECKEAMQFYVKHKGEEYCPKINSPLELSRKWKKLEDHVDRIK